MSRDGARASAALWRSRVALLPAAARRLGARGQVGRPIAGRRHPGDPSPVRPAYACLAVLLAACSGSAPTSFLGDATPPAAEQDAAAPPPATDAGPPKADAAPDASPAPIPDAGPPLPPPDAADAATGTDATPYLWMPCDPDAGDPCHTASLPFGDPLSVLTCYANGDAPGTVCSYACCTTGCSAQGLDPLCNKLDGHCKGTGSAAVGSACEPN